MKTRALVALAAAAAVAVPASVALSDAIGPQSGIASVDGQVTTRMVSRPGCSRCWNIRVPLRFAEPGRYTILFERQVGSSQAARGAMASATGTVRVPMQKGTQVGGVPVRLNGSGTIASIVSLAMVPNVELQLSVMIQSTVAGLPVMQEYAGLTGLRLRVIQGTPTGLVQALQWGW